MRTYLLGAFAASALALFSCTKPDDDDNGNIITEQQKNQFETVKKRHFVWSAMNRHYLWKHEVADLADSKKKSLYDQEYLDYLSSFDTPKDLYNSLLSEKDRFSQFSEDYRTLAPGLTYQNGVSSTPGVIFNVLFCK